MQKLIKWVDERVHIYNIQYSIMECNVKFCAWDFFYTCVRRKGSCV